MKIQYIAVVFVIIILPIAMVMSSYIGTQIDTITLQTKYDTKLTEATYDAIKSFQINTVNNRYSTVSDSKIRDIEASVSTFKASVKSVFGMNGYSEDEMNEYRKRALSNYTDKDFISKLSSFETSEESLD